MKLIKFSLKKILCLLLFMAILSFGEQIDKILAVTPVLSESSSVTEVPSVKNVSVNSDFNKAPVIFYEEELFFINNPLGNFSPEERARIVTDRLKKISEDPSFNPEEIKVEIRNSQPCIIYKNIIIITVRNEDGISSGLDGIQIAEQYAEKIRNTVTDYRNARSIKTIILGIIFSLITTLLFIFTFKILNKFLSYIYKKIDVWEGTRISDLKFQNLVLLSGARIIEIIIFIVKLSILFVKFIIFYIYLSLIFSFFVWTRHLGSHLLGYIFSWLNVIWGSVLSYIPHLFFIFFAAVVTYYIIKFVRFIFIELEKGTIEFPGFYRDWAKPTYMIVRFLIIALAVIIVFPYLPGYDSPAFKSISIFLGVLFSLGSTAFVSNIVAGIILIYMNAFRIGDRVKIGDVTGDIAEKTLLVTRIRTIKNVDITMPNAMILGNYITNYSACSKEKGLILHTTVTIGYDVPWKDVHRLLIDAALASEGILKEPSPFILQTSLDDFYVSYELNAYTDNPNAMARIYSEIHRNIQDKFNEGGVEIMSPHYRALRDGNQTTIPLNYLQKDYSSPSFKICQEEKKP